MSSRRIAIVGGGLSGLALAYDLVRRGRAGDLTLFEQESRLGGVIETVHREGFVIECGPDAWLTEKPWARELACELGLQDELLASEDATRKTYILRQNRLVAMPDGMRLMVPTDLKAAARSGLFSPRALASFQQEIAHASMLRQAAPKTDESVASFVQRHFGSEVLETVAAPLLSGIFGGDVRRLSAHAVLSQLVAIEKLHGSLIAGLQIAAASRESRAQDQGSLPGESMPVFTTLRSGLSTLVEALTVQIPASSIRKSRTVQSLRWSHGRWLLRSTPAQAGKTASARGSGGVSGGDEESFDTVVLATLLDTMRHLLAVVDASAAALLPKMASSAVTIAFAWRHDRLSERDRRRTGTDRFQSRPGFGFLVPPRRGVAGAFGPQILATTFADQKFPGRAPPDGRLLRAFYGGAAAERLWHLSDARLAARALDELRSILGPLPAARPLTVLRRWPHSLPQYEVGHLGRVDALEQRLRTLPGFHLLGSALHGVGLPDLVRDARALAKVIA